MEQFKGLDEIFEPDVRMDLFRSTLEADHKRLSEIRLGATVPEDVKNYFETIKNLCPYGRFVYAFYAVAQFLTFPLLEMALYRRLLPTKPRRRGEFRRLLNRAVKLRLIEEDSFSHVRRIKENRAQMEHIMQQIGRGLSPPAPAEDYMEILKEALPHLRNNVFAHPRSLAVQTPSDAFFSIRFVAEFVNQLFASSSSSARD